MNEVNLLPKNFIKSYITYWHNKSKFKIKIPLIFASRIILMTRAVKVAVRDFELNL